MNEAVQQAWQDFCRQPGEETFSAFYQRTSGFIFTICLRVLGDHDEATDVLQTVYSKLLMLAHSGAEGLAIADIDEVVKQFTLRFSETRRKGIQRSSARLMPEEALSTIASGDLSARAIVADRQVHEAVREAISQLEPEQKKAVLMQFEDGKTHQAIADELGRSRSYITKLIQRATRELENHLRAAGITESTILLLVLVLGKKSIHATVGLKSAVVFARAKLAVPGLTAPATAYLKAAALLKTKAFMVTASAMVIGLAVFSLQFRNLKVPVTSSVTRGPATATIEPPSRATGSKGANAQQLANTSKPAVQSASSTIPSGGSTSTGSIAGQIISRYTREPLVNIPVQAIAAATSAVDPRLAAVTDANGEFKLSAVEPGNYQIRVTPDAPWVEEVTSASVIAAELQTIGPIQLNRLGAIYGRVINETDESPVPDIQVQAQNSSFAVVAETRTGADGRFAIKGLPLPFYGIHLPSVKASKSIAMTAGKDENTIIRLGTRSISGQVTRAGEPLPQAYVLAHRNETNGYMSHFVWAGPDGKFELNGLGAGEWSLKTHSVDVELSTQFATATMNLATTSTVSWNPVVPSGRLAGTAKDHSGHPLANILVRAERANGSSDDLPNWIPSTYVTSSSLSGTYAFRGLPPAEYVVSLITQDHVVGNSAITKVPPEGEVTADIRLSAARTGSLRSTVLSFATEQPLSEAWCSLVGPSGPISLTGKRDADGLLKIDGLEPGKYAVSISAYGYTAATRQVLIEAGKTVSIEDVLEDGGAFTWVLFDEAGLGKPNVACRLDPADPRSLATVRTGTTDAEGCWKIRGLQPGQYLATATLPTVESRLQVVINARAITQNRTKIAESEAASKVERAATGG